MNISQKFIYILIIFLIFEFSFSDDDPKIKLLYNFTELYINNINYTNYTNSTNDTNYINYTDNTLFENLLLGNIKFLDNDNIFYNIPRNNYTINNNTNLTFAKVNVTKIDNKDYIEYSSWPNDEWNMFPNDDNCSIFISIIAFEFDDNNNIYLLDEGNGYCPIKLYKFNSKGDFRKEYIIYNNAENINIIDFVLDKINDYVYISYYNNSNYKIDDINIEYEEGFIVKKLDKNDEDAKFVLLNDTKLKFDEKYRLSKRYIEGIFPNITKKEISISLSCDGEVLFFSPISSRMIYSIKTKKLRKIKHINIDDVNESYKNDANSAMISSNLGNLYLNGLENNVIYIAGQIDKDLTLFDYKGVDKRKMENNNIVMHWPTKMSINDGKLFIICKNITEENDTFILRTEVFELSIYKEKSYVYKCAGIGQKWDWETYIVWILFIAIVIFVLVFVFIGNKEDKVINKKD